MRTLLPYVPYAMLALVLALILWRGLRRVRVRERRLWIAPLLVTAGIGSGLWFNPHPAFQPLNILLLTGAAMLGAGFGLWRAFAARLQRHADGSVWMTTSPAALVAILGLFAARTLLRGITGADGDPHHMTASALLAFDAFLIFALAMVLANRYALWQRIRQLHAPNG